MARYRYPREGNGRTTDQNGRVLSGVTIQVYLEGTTTLANFYLVPTGGTPVTSMLSSESGEYSLWIDAVEYPFPQGFDIVKSKTSANGITYTSDIDKSVPISWPNLPDIVVNLTGGADGNVVSFEGDTGLSIKDSGIPSSSVVTLTDAQTLTNKTLTLPKINENVALTVTATQLNSATSTQHTQNTDTGTTSTSWVVNSGSGTNKFTLTTSSLVSDASIDAADISDAVSKKHSQNTDTGTTATSFVVNSGSGTNKLTLTTAGLSANASIDATDISDAISKKHARQHSITASLDHTSTATSGKMLKANTDGLPIDASNTDTEVSAAVSASHARQHSITSSSDHTSSLSSGQMLKADANGLPANATNTDSAVSAAVSASHTQNTDTGTTATSWVTNSGSATNKFTITTSGLSSNASIDASVLSGLSANSHVQNTDTGTTSTSWVVNSGSATKKLTVTTAGLAANASIDAVDIAASISAKHTQNTDTGTTGNSFAIGDGAASDKKVIIQNAAANKPYWGYKNSSSRFVYSDDGVAENTLAGQAMTYPGAGVAVSGGSSWSSSLTVGTGNDNLVKLNGSAQLPAVSGALLTNLPSQAPTYATEAEVLTGTESAKVVSPANMSSSNVRKLLTAAGDIVYASAANTLARLAKGSDTQVLTLASGLPTWAAPASATIADGSITPVKLKTATAEVSVSVSMGSPNTGVGYTASLPGGNYGFIPKVKNTTGTQSGTFSNGTSTLSCVIGSGSTTSYICPGVRFSRADIAGSSDDGYTYNIYYTSALTGYASQTYGTASNMDAWYMCLRDKITKERYQDSVGFDHPCFGYGGDPSKMPHLFGDYDTDKYELVIAYLTQNQVDEIESRRDYENDAAPDRSMLDVIHADYTIVEDIEAEWPQKEFNVGFPKGFDWRSARDGDLVMPIMQVVPKPEYALCRAIRLKG